MKKKFNITGMSCASCSAHVEKSVKKLSGIKSVNVNLLSNTMSVEYDETAVSGDTIIKAVEGAGYGACPLTPGGEAAKKSAGAENAGDAADGLKRRFILSLVFLLPLLYISMGHMLGFYLPAFLSGIKNAAAFAFLQFLLVLPIVYVNHRYFEGGFKALFHGSPNMDSLVAVGSSAALAYGIFAIFQIGYGLGNGRPEIAERYYMDLYFESAAMILTLITLGKYLEARAKGKTGEAVGRLLNLAPKMAIVEKNGVQSEIPVEKVAVGDIIIVKPGMSVPVDGVITEGSSSVDESALTGESIPAEKKPGDTVAAATINKSGYFKFKAQKVGEDTTLAQIIKLVEEAGASKAPIARLADKISGVFVPVVMGIAVLSALIWLLSGQSFEFALSTGIAVLVISCPCALGLATPVAIMVGTGRGAEDGILFKSAQALETAHSVKTVVLDKTGTITKGKPEVTDVIAAPGKEKSHLLSIAAALEKPSEHPLADAIVKYTKDFAGKVSAEDFEALPGQGVRAVIGKTPCFAGNPDFIAGQGIDISPLRSQYEELALDGKTPLVFAEEKSLLGLIAVADKVKPTSAEAIKELKSMGIAVVMLTGDNKRTAQAVRKRLDIDKAVAEVLPQDKEREIRLIAESGKKVAMIGDGINDAPALTRADVGIAIGAGTDVAIESADVVLIKSDLLDAATAIRLSRAVIRNVRQNLFWAFFYNIIGIPIAAGVLFPLFGIRLSPMIAAAAMSASSVCVVTNALRLRFFKSRKAPLIKEAEEQTDDTIKGEKIMKKVIVVNGMMCAHCKAAVEKALCAIDGVSAEVDLEKKTAAVSSSAEVSDDVLKTAVTDAGYEVVSIKNL